MNYEYYKNIKLFLSNSNCQNLFSILILIEFQFSIFNINKFNLNSIQILNIKNNPLILS